MNISFEPATEKDREILSLQLKGREVSVMGILSRCVHGMPRVVILDPVKHTKSVPAEDMNCTALANVLWLTCPYLNDKIHNIESGGMVSRIQTDISENRHLAEMMENAHAHFYFLRKSIYYRATGTVYSEDMIPFFNLGVGGVADTCAVKCIHMHYCHFIVCSENFAGRVAHKAVGVHSDCKEGVCAHAVCAC